METYSVVVTDLPARDLLFQLARDAKVNIDVNPDIEGRVTINAINQTLPQILDRISKQVDIRYELENGTYHVMKDSPYLKTYKIDFINMSRTAESRNATSGQIAGNVGTGGTGSTSTAGNIGNISSTTVTSKTVNDLMESLIQDVKNILLDEDKIHFNERIEVESKQKTSARGDGIASAATSFGSQQGSRGNQQSNGANAQPAAGGSVAGSGNQDVQGSGSLAKSKAEYERAVNVFANKETGVLIVRATAKQHEKIQEFIDKVMNSAKRQVLIEATIVEVQLNDRYQQGINWSRALLGAQGFALSQAGTVGIAGTAGALTINYLDPNSQYGNLLASINLLQQFGNVKVLSSPKLTVMNNQTASLKVATNKVYFQVKADVIPATATSAASASYSTTPNTVSVGLTMSVTPQISDNDLVTLNVRPSISSEIGAGIQDPNPILANPCGFGVTNCTIAPIKNVIPEIQTREMESIIKVSSGQTAVMGGLIQESINKNSNEVPFLARIPLIGNLFQNRDDKTTKSELVIFLRPVVIKDASLAGDFQSYGKNLPDAEFFHEDARGKHIEP